MSRPARVDIKGGWYHVSARGIERRRIFETPRDHEHFLELLEEMTERYAVEIHAYALMGNHYHLLIRTPSANASRALQWLNVSYSAWFNRKRERVGHVFQGRFGSVLIDGNGAWTLNASVYIHLNPIRTRSEGLGKSANRAEGMGLKAPSREEVRRRLTALRNFQWNSYRAYAGYEKGASWLTTEELLKRGGGRRAYRRYVQTHVTRGADPEGFEDLRGKVALGTREFLDRAKGWVKGLTKEHSQRKWARRTVSVEAIVALVERERGLRWEEFRDRHGDWGRDLVVYLARKRSGRTLREIGEALGIAEYKTVGKACQRFEASLAADASRRRLVKRCLGEMSLVET